MCSNHWQVPSLVLLLFIYVLFHLPKVLVHPILSLIGVFGVLIEAALLSIPLCCNAFGCVVLKRHLFAFVLKWVEWLGLPFHHPVLVNQLNPLRGMVSSGSAHAEPLLVAVTLRYADCLHNNLGLVEGLHAIPKLFVAHEASVRKRKNLVHDGV